jgi:hypothetical protein
MALAVTLLSAVEATGTGDTKHLGDFSVDSEKDGVPDKWTVEITTTDNATAVTIDLEGSIDDGTTFHQLAQHVMTAAELSADQAMFHVVGKGATSIRGNMTTFTQAASETVTVKAIAVYNT